MNKPSIFFIITVVCLFIWPPAAQAAKNEIQVGAMDVIKNLNPYLAQCEIELALQKVVFPPLIADFIEDTNIRNTRSQEGSSFKGLLIADGDINRRAGDESSLLFTLSGSKVDAQVLVENFERIKALGPKSNYSWNLNRIEVLKNGMVQMTFDREYILGKFIAAAFPLVDFKTIEGQWDRSDQVFITHSDRHLLGGYSGYQYSKIDQRSSITILSPKENQPGKNLVVKSFPDYKQLVDRLNAGEIQAAFNLSALTENFNPDIALDDMKFANQYILYMTVTPRGKQKGLADMDIIDYIRNKFNDSFPGDRVLYSSGNVFKREGFLLESAQFQQVDKDSIRSLNPRGAITLLYYRNTINDRVKTMMEGILQEMGYTLRAVAIDPSTSSEKIDETDFDLVMKAAYIHFPEFLNLRYYKEFIEQSPLLASRGYTRRIDQLLSQGGRLNAIHEEAQKLEKTLLKNIPLVFFLRYNTRVAVKKGTQNYRATKGVPFFFYNLSQW